MKLKKIFNPPEKETYGLLLKVCKARGCQVFPKIRIADVFSIDRSGISDSEYEYALKAHFDFLIADENDDPQFAVEFDGNYHLTTEQRQRDSIKDSLIERFNFPLLRVGFQEITNKYRDLDLLTYFVEIWYTSQAFLDAQEQGLVPFDEIFDPFSILCVPDRKGHFPYWLSLNARAAMKKLYESSKISEPIPTVYVGLDKEGRYHGLSIVKINDENCVSSQFSIKSQHFPIILSNVIEDVLVCDLYERLLLAVDKPGYTITLGKAINLLEEYERYYEMRSYTSSFGQYKRKK